MARPKHQPTPEPDVAPDGRAISTALAAADKLSAADAIAAQQSEIYRLVGRIESAHFLETVSSRMIGEAYLAARDLIGKLGSLVVLDSTGTGKRVSSLEEFCEAVMPVSHRRCNQIAAALHTLGPALYEQAEQLGLGTRNYNAIRALPNDMQDQVKAAITSGDKGQVVTLIEELAARNASLHAEAADLRKTAVAKDRVIAKKDAKLNQLAEAEEIRRNGTPDERERQQLDELGKVGLACHQSLQQLLAAVDAVFAAPATEAAELQARMSIEYVVQRFADAMNQRGIHVDRMADLVVEPGWARKVRETAEAGTKATAAKPAKAGKA